MKIISRGTTEFWALYRELPVDAKVLARKIFRIWLGNPFYPSLHFKPLKKPNWSVRVGDHYRAVGIFLAHEFVWQWIGTHEAYNKRF